MINYDFSQIPQTSGVYKFYDNKRKIIYIGKAVNLRSRIRSYFTSKHYDRPVIRTMIPLIGDIQYIETENEIEALILESNLIKKHRPYYNLALKDDKNYVWIHIDNRSKFPKIAQTRDLDKKGKYFGPYPDGRPTKRMLKYLRYLYPYADCSLKFYPQRSPNKIKKQRVCLYYHLGLCPGPCDNLITSEEYKKNITEIILILEGKKLRHISEIERRMLKYSRNRNYEKAAILRDKIKDLKYISQRIDIASNDTEQDYLRLKHDRDLAGIAEILKYSSISKKPNFVRIECYDIANISGQNSYGSMTVSQGDELLPSNYRIFKINETKPDDVKMLNSVLTRRYPHINKSSDTSLNSLPDIILIDGGKSQLSGVPKYFLDKTIILGISKGKKYKRFGLPERDEFWIMNKDRKVRKIIIKNPYIFSHLRDEAHRFARKYHHKSRKLEQKQSLLDSIKGVGEIRRKLLLRRFKSIKGIKNASVEKINQVVKNKNISEIIKRKLH